MPLWLAERYEWQQLAANVADAAASLEARERERSIVLTPDYPRAAVFEFFGKARGLPTV